MVNRGRETANDVIVRILARAWKSRPG